MGAGRYQKCSYGCCDLLGRRHATIQPMSDLHSDELLAQVRRELESVLKERDAAKPRA